MKTVLFLLGLFCLQTAASADCLSAKLRKKLDEKRDPVERYLLLAKVGEKQASRLLRPPPGSFEQPEQPPLLKRQTIRDMWELHDCAWSELLEELWHWKPQHPRDRDSIRELLSRARHDEKMLNEVIEYQQLQPSAEPPPGSLKPKCLETIHDVEERLQALSRGVT